MIVTFPHLGNAYICVKVLLDELGIDYIVPSRNHKQALEAGTRYCPECACLPLKINIGNYLEARRMGADTILMTGGCGPCRFGYYCEMQREILKDIGKEMDMITLEAPYGDLAELFRRICRLAGGIKPVKTLNALFLATKTAIRVDELEKLCFRLRCREADKGSADMIYNEFKNQALNVKGIRATNRLLKITEARLKSIRADYSGTPLKVGIIGEIYTTIDSSTNFQIESKLGEMGVEVDRAVTVSGWIIEHMLKNALPFLKDLKYAEAAKPYLNAMIGGHARESIGNAVLYKRKGYDGIIQIYPLTCMPEIVAQSILNVVSKELDIPVLTVLIDEMTGEAGYMTRLEAFVDILESKRKANKQLTVKGCITMQRS